MKRRACERHRGLNPQWRTVMLRQIIIVGALSLAAACSMDHYVPTAAAANLPGPVFKAPAYTAPVCTATDCSGFYAGVSLQGSGSNLDILGSGINNSVFAAGGVLGGVAGYQFWNGQMFFAPEANLGVNVNPSGLGGAVGSHSLEGNVLLKAGVALTNVLGIGQPGTAGSGTASQGINLAVIPGTTMLSPYAVIGDSFKQGSNGWTGGAGTVFNLAKGWNLDVYYHRINWNNTQTAVVPGAAISTQPAENRVGFALLKMF
jgi:opacity protein-like surface antigen